MKKENKTGNQKDIKYFSTDKMYKVKHKKHAHIKAVSFSLMLVTLGLLIFSIMFLLKSVNLNRKDVALEYTETGKADYTVYLRDNDYYETKYLPSGMQYVANLINTVNAKFNYELHADEKLDFNYTYKVVGQLQITDVNDTNKIIYTKDYDLVDATTEKIKSDNLVVNIDADVDYDKYNGYVNSYKSDYAISASSQLLVTMYINVTGKYDDNSDVLTKNDKLQITVPLSEQTLGIAIDTDDIRNTDVLKTKALFINNIPIFISSLCLLALSIVILIMAIKLYKEYIKENIYTITVNKILKEYDRLIVNGNINIDEAKYTNKVHPETFAEMVDASQNLNAPILFYNVIPGEKCFFVITKADTLYKFRLTKAYLEKEEEDKKNKK